jgi:hypothetical protein
LILAVFVISLFFPWSPIWCKHIDVDIATGRLRYSRYFMFCKVFEKIEDTPMTKALPPDVIAGSNPEWRRAFTFSPGLRHSPHYMFHGAIRQINTLERAWKKAEEYGFSKEMQQKTALDLLSI